MEKYESPQYDVTLKEDAYEIRTYSEFYVVEYDNANDPQIDRGFGTLFNYISNDNANNTKIAMTVPVIEEVSHQKKKMAFVVPGKFGDHIPKPNNDHLTVKKFEGGLFAVIAYSGFSNETKETKMRERLQTWLIEKGYKSYGNYMLAFYTPPFVPPMFRKNEIMIRIEIL